MPHRLVKIYSDQSIIINAVLSRNTNFQWKKFDGTDLEYTNWGKGHPSISSGVAIYNGKK